MSHLRMAPPPESSPLTFDDAQKEFQVHYKAARTATIDALGAFGGHLIKELLTAQKGISIYHLRAIRNHAQEVASCALRIVSELNAAIEACERVKETQ